MVRIAPRVSRLARISALALPEQDGELLGSSALVHHTNFSVTVNDFVNTLHTHTY